MAFNIRMGLPEMEKQWNDLSGRKRQGRLNRDEEKFFKKLVKCLGYLAENPRHNSLENNTPSAGRIFWAYGPEQRDITVMAVEPHPEDQKRGAYQRIKLSGFPPTKPV